MLLITIHHLFQSFVFPPLNAMLIMLAGLIILRFRRKLGISLVILGIICLYVQSIPITAYLLKKSFELPPISRQELRRSQAIVIIGGGLNYSPEYPKGIGVTSSTLIRLKYVSYLAKQYPDKLIVTSGGYTGTIREANIMKDVLIDSYGIKNPIITEDNSRNTDENAKFVANILLPMNIKTIALVTQAYHMQRAIMLFKKYGLEPIPASTDYYDKSHFKTKVLAFIPTASSMQQVALVFHEALGNLLYK